MNRREFLTVAASLAAIPTVFSETQKASDPPSDVEREALDPKGLISVKPHVQLLGENSLAVVWMTRENAEGWVEWSQDGGTTWTRAWDERDGLLVNAFDRIHKIVVTGYDPTKSLRYRVHARLFKCFEAYKIVRADEEAMCEGELNAVLPSDGGLSFAMFNDVHETLDVYPALAKYMDGPFSFTVFNGDIMSHVDEEAGVARNILAPLAYCAVRTKAPMWYLRGNHETRGPFARHLRDYVALQDDRYYGAVTLGDARFVFIDSGEDKTDDNHYYFGLVDFDRYIAAQTEWLKAEVASEAWKRAKFRIVTIHIPPAIDYGDKIWKQKLSRLDALHAVLDTAGTTLVLGAHIHRWGVNAPGTTHPYALVVGGGTGIDPNKQQNRPTLTRCDIRDGKITIRLFTPEGEVARLDGIPDNQPGGCVGRKVT